MQLGVRCLITVYQLKQKRVTVPTESVVVREGKKTNLTDVIKNEFPKWSYTGMDPNSILVLFLDPYPSDI